MLKKNDWHENVRELVDENHEPMMVNEEDFEFKIPGLPHSIQKIENHANRHALQRDLQQSQSFYPFSQESKETTHEVGNIDYVKYSIWNPKHSAKYVYHTETSASSTARAGTSCEKEQRRIRNLSSTRWTSFQFLTTT